MLSTSAVSAALLDDGAAAEIFLFEDLVELATFATSISPSPVLRDVYYVSYVVKKAESRNFLYKTHLELIFSWPSLSPALATSTLFLLPLHNEQRINA